MADNQQDNTQKDTKPTEDQVKSANEAEMKRWEGDFSEEDLKVEYKREESEEKPEDKSKEEATTAEESEDDEEQEELAEPVPVVTVEDPGEYKPADYSFKVSIKGKSVKVNSPEEADTLADDPENFETPKQLMDFLRQSNKMQNNLDRDREKWESQKDQFESQSAVQTQRNEYIEQVDKEIQYLVASGELPEITDQTIKSRWLTDPNASLDKEFIKSPGVKEQVELVNRLAEERDRRVKAGLSPLVSALDVWKDIKLEKQTKQEETREAGETRKAAGSRVAGVSSSQQTPYVPKGIAVGRTGIFDRNQAVWDD